MAVSRIVVVFVHHWLSNNSLFMLRVMKASSIHVNFLTDCFNSEMVRKECVQSPFLAILLPTGLFKRYDRRVPQWQPLVSSLSA